MKRISIILNLILFNFIYAECYELSQAECLYWSSYCEWNEETGQCQEIGGGGTGGGTGGGDGNGDGPYDFATITESQGLRNGPDYRDGVVYYPIGGEAPYKSIVLTPGFGGGSSEMTSWAEFYASHGFIAMRIGPNDEINDSHYMRGLGLIDAIESIRQENNRIGSPLNGLIDENSFSVSGYSMGGGASHDAAMMDSSLAAVISLNPTVIFEDCDLCPVNYYDGVPYCICLVPEFVNHAIPSLIFAGEVEVNELTAYEGLLGQDIYANMPESTDKILFEGANSGHGFAAYPYGEVQEYALNWLKFQVLNDSEACEALLNIPSSASQYLTSNIECAESVAGDINGDLLVNVQDVILTVNLILSAEYNSSADLNLDGNIDVLDIVQIVNIILR
tara:strand:- start:12817 stop:13989 length:1173 start_codon:yes stop_codon:yes gene_type:complete